MKALRVENLDALPLSKELWLKLGVRDSKERVADVGVWAAQGTALSPGAAAAGSESDHMGPVVAVLPAALLPSNRC